MKLSTATLGFPRMGPNRELKFALEKHWKGQLSEKELLEVAEGIEKQGWKLQKDAGIGRITVGDYSLYDFVATWTEMLGMVPKRFETMQPGLERMFAMCRGVESAPALSMKKWICSNYHYMVPEYDETSKIQPDFVPFLNNIKRGRDILGVDCATPVVLGPVSLVRFTKIKDSKTSPTDILKKLIPVYASLMKKIATLGFTEIQIHEPALVFAETSLIPLFELAYPAILESTVSINMVSFMDDVGEDNYKWLISKPEINTVSIDFTRGNTLQLVEKFGFPASKTLGVGIVDARNVWKVFPSDVSPILEKLDKMSIASACIQPSGSLQYNPWDFQREEDLQNHPAAAVLSFAKQKLDEVVLVAKSAADGQVLQGHESAWKTFAKNRADAASSVAKKVTDRVKSLTPKDFARHESYTNRRSKQMKGIPSLPTTTIGSFPQTAEIRRLRSQWKKGNLTDEEYKSGIDKQIAYCIGVQEAIGLDILVHGEAERTDMVEFFAHQMEGMLFTTHGWVQSFGSRCVRPPIFWNDIVRENPMTIREFQVAQELTSKPVKGMLTGPITILNWSFPRVDIKRKEQAYQIALAIRDEISDLEAANCKVVQVDEPALREGMPLRQGAKEEYLQWAVDAFRLATAGAKSETQIQTHMCYCEFSDCMGAIDRLDTDVNSIENARNGNETLQAFRDFGYNKGFGPGTYDIHSPVVPSVDSQKQKIDSFLQCLEVGQLVVNPDCGLKTRTWPETVAALQNMVAATQKVRAERGLVGASQ